MDTGHDNSKHNLYDLKIPFPFKLHEMLSDVARGGNERIVSWQPHGKAFRVHKRDEFVDKIMKKYFHQSKYKSFQRQLHIYGFHRISKGLDKGAYYHPKFILGEETTSLRMTRRKIKGPLADEEIGDPDFYQGEIFTPKVEPYFVNTVPERELSSHDGLQVGSRLTAPPSMQYVTSLTISKCEDSVLPMKYPMPDSKLYQKNQHVFQNTPFDRRPSKMTLRD